MNPPTTTSEDYIPLNFEPPAPPPAAPVLPPPPPTVTQTTRVDQHRYFEPTSILSLSNTGGNGDLTAQLMRMVIRLDKENQNLSHRLDQLELSLVGRLDQVERILASGGNTPLMAMDDIPHPPLYHAPRPAQQVQQTPDNAMGGGGGVGSRTFTLTSDGNVDYVSILNVYCQTRLLKLPEYTFHETGLKGNELGMGFLATVRVFDQLFESENASSKKANAKQAAARVALSSRSGIISM